MRPLDAFLVEKRAAFRARHAAALADPQPSRMEARGRVAGSTGVREIRIRDFQIVSDTPPSFAGQDLGPNAPELMLGALASCLCHITLIIAADRELSLESVRAEVRGQLHPLAQTPGYEDVPVSPHALSYTLHLESAESPERIAELSLEIDRLCPVYNLIRNPQSVAGEIVHTAPGGVPVGRIAAG